MRAYDEFLRSKAVKLASCPIVAKSEINPALYPFQRDIARWALRKGRAAIFADCGMGKSPIQLEWARHIDGPVLIVAPLAVAQQTVAEGEKFGVPVAYSRTGKVNAHITITNYEMIDHFSATDYAGLVCDESGILKSLDGKIKRQLIETFDRVPFKLACTATPSPNDHMELGNHAEFLGVLTRAEMLSTYFVHDGAETQKWRLKGHAHAEFWKWVCSWAVMLRHPSDLGYEDGGFRLPPMTVEHREVATGGNPVGTLFALPANTLGERRQARSGSVAERAAAVAEIVASAPGEQWLIWCNLNNEANAVTKRIEGAVNVQGADSFDDKERNMLDFAAGRLRVMVSKPSICGLGMNLQSCHNVVFLGLSDSFEQYYQAIRRCHRFGQKRPVRCFIVTSTLEGAVVDNIARKEKAALEMAEEMVKHMHDVNVREIRGEVELAPETAESRSVSGRGWEMVLGDCVEGLKALAPNSMHYSIYSPPFASLFTYSASNRDMGNCRTHSEFYGHFEFLIDELRRVMMPGRLVSFHCMNLPTSKERDGVIGITDFRGELIRMFQQSGFIYHSEVCIWKDPVTAMQRTKALGLLHKQIKKDSCMSRQGIPDYLVTMRKPGENPERVTHTNESFPVSLWQRYASPVWMDINQSDTLQRESAREERDERHICPLQLQVIERAVQLWSNPGDLVLSPFAGIGSEGYVALKMGRRFIGFELKQSYFDQSVLNLTAAEQASAGLLDSHAEVTA